MHTAPWLSKPFVDARFQLLQQQLTGQQEIQAPLEALRRAPPMARSAKRSARSTSSETFGADGKARMLKMVDALEKSAGAGHQRPCPG